MSISKLPSPAMAVAVIALVAALGGSAVALQGKNSVKSNDIAPNAVKGKDIATGAVKPADLDDLEVDGEAGPLPTASVPAIDLGGPSVTVQVPETGLVAIYVAALGRSTAAGATRWLRSICSSPRCCRMRRVCSSSPRRLRSCGSRRPGPATSTAQRHRRAAAGSCSRPRRAHTRSRSITASPAVARQRSPTPGSGPGSSASTDSIPDLTADARPSCRGVAVQGWVGTGVRASLNTFYAHSRQ